MKGQFHHIFVMVKTATVTRVSRNPNNKLGCIVSLSNKDTLWLQTSYVQSVLASNFIDDVRPTALIGSEVSYDMKSYVVGDLVFDRKGQVAAGETVKFSKAGSRPVNILFAEVEGHIGEYDKARMLSTAVANAMVKSAGAFAPIKRIAAIAEPAGETADADTSAVLADGVDAGEATI